MASNSVLILLSAVLFTTVVGYKFCRIQRETVICRSMFCCGTCDDSYCCTDPEKSFTWEAQRDCFFKEHKISPKYFPQSDAVPIAVCMVVAIVVLFFICWVCPCCYLYRRFRNPTSVTTTTTSSRHNTFPRYHHAGWSVPSVPMSTGPPPSYQEAVSPGYTVPIHDGGQATYPLQSLLPTDYTSPQPAYNPAYTSCTSSFVKTGN